MSDFKKMMKALDRWLNGVSDEYDTALDRWLDEVRAEAWDEGNDAGWTEANAHHENAATYPKLKITNPYRQEQDQ